MKKFFPFFLFIILLTGCGSGTSDVNGNPADSGAQAKKLPQIPKSLKASVLEANDDNSYESLDELMKEIDTDLNRPNITEEDIRRGYYLGNKDQKKYGTPSTWFFADDDGEAKWMSPNLIEEHDYLADKKLCEATAGKFVISCIDREIENCEYAPKTECKCIEGTKWSEGQGCIALDEEGNFVVIYKEDLLRGWYQGLPNQKRLDTPESWIWLEAGAQSRWQNPRPQ